MPNETRALRSRLDFSKIPTPIQIPNLIEVQRRSYERFLQMDKLPSERDDNGLHSVFTSVFPITDFRNISQLDFVDFSIGNWACTTSGRPATTAATWSSPTRSTRAMFCATSAARTTRTPRTSATSAATRWVCSSSTTKRSARSGA